MTGDNPVGTGAGNQAINAQNSMFSSAYIPLPLSLSPEGFIGGGQLGYLFRTAPQIVLGIEADLQFSNTDERASTSGTVAIVGVSLGSTTRQDLEWFGTLRGRLGYLISDDLMIFGSGGLALGKSAVHTNISHISGPTWNHMSFTTSFSSCGSQQACFAGSSSGTSTGWALGGGFEWALTSAISLKAEYLRLDFGNETVRMNVVAPTTGDAFTQLKVKHAYDIARVGLNVRF